MTKMNGTTMKASMKVETSLEAPKVHHECVVAEVVGAMLEAAVVALAEARLEISREKMAIVSKSAAVKEAYPWEVVVEVLRDVVISLHDVEAAEAEQVVISPVVNSQVKLITVTEATGYPLVILEDFKAVLIPGIILGIPRTTVRRHRVIEVMEEETTEVVALDVGEGAVVEEAALAKTRLTTPAIGAMISHKLMTGIMRSILDL